MWMGSQKRVTVPGLLGLDAGDPPTPRTLDRDHTPALLKLIDEAVVNAADHAKEHGRGPASRRVRHIALQCSPASGEIIVENDGPGMPVELSEAETAKLGKPVWIPEIILGRYGFQAGGRNLVKAAECVKGGTNGVGAKLINFCSERLVLTTTRENKTYRQEYRDRNGWQSDPEVSAAPRGRPEGTTLSFIPVYRRLGYSPGPGGAALAAEDAADLLAWMRLRMHLVAAYVGSAVRVTFNGELCAASDAAGLVRVLTAPAERDPNEALFALKARAAPPFSGTPGTSRCTFRRRGKATARLRC